MTEIGQSVPSRRQQETPGSRPPRTTPSQIRSLHSGNKQKWPLSSRHLKKFTDLDTDYCSGKSRRDPAFLGFCLPLALSLPFSGSYTATLAKLLS